MVFHTQFCFLIFIAFLSVLLLLTAVINLSLLFYIVLETLCNIAMIRICETYMHKMFIRIGIRKTRNTDDSLSLGTKHLLPSLSLGLSTRGEMDIIFICWLFVHRQLSTHWSNQSARAPPSLQTAQASPRSEKSTRFANVQISTNCFYSKSLRILAHRFRA